CANVLVRNLQVRQSPASRMPHGRSGSAQPPAASGLSVERRTPTCRLQLCSACSCSADGLEQPPAWLPPGPLQAAAPAAARGTPSPVGHGAPAGHGLGALALAAHRLTGRRRRRRAARCCKPRPRRTPPRLPPPAAARCTQPPPTAARHAAARLLPSPCCTA
ncbi:Os04g0147600, partial [Oryza sativa Japonica Group]